MPSVTVAPLWADAPRRWAFAVAHRWPSWVGRLGIEVEHVLHAGDVFAVDLQNAPHVFAPGLRPFSARRRRTVSCDRLLCSVSLICAAASSLSIQRVRPFGGLAQAVATSKASSLPVSLRSAPEGISSLSARSRLPSTKRRLVRYTVEPHAGLFPRQPAFGSPDGADAETGRPHQTAAKDA